MPTPVIACFSSYSVELVHRMANDATVGVLLPPVGTDGASPAARQSVVAELVRDADIVIGDAARRYLLDAAAIAAMRRCRFIQQPSVGYNTIDVAAATDHGIGVANTPGYNADAVADWVLMAILAVLRGGLAADAMMRRGEWRPWRDCHELGALTVGIVGMGHIGSAVARRVHGFGSRIRFASRRPHDLPGMGDARRLPLPELLRSCDIVTLHVPQTAETTGMIGAAELAAMRDDSILVNAARGPIMDEAALIDVLRRRPGRWAALDVFTHEPLADDSPLRSLPNVYLSPHIAANTAQARDRVHEMVGANLRLVLAGEAPHDLVNPEVIPLAR